MSAARRRSPSAPPLRRRRRAVDPNRAAVGPNRTGEHADRRALSRSVRAQQAKRLARRELKRNAVHGDRRPESTFEIAELRSSGHRPIVDVRSVSYLFAAGDRMHCARFYPSTTSFGGRHHTVHCHARTTCVPLVRRISRRISSTLIVESTRWIGRPLAAAMASIDVGAAVDRRQHLLLDFVEQSARRAA